MWALSGDGEAGRRLGAEWLAQWTSHRQRNLNDFWTLPLAAQLHFSKIQTCFAMHDGDGDWNGGVLMVFGMLPSSLHWVPTQSEP